MKLSLSHATLLVSLLLDRPVDVPASWLDVAELSGEGLVAETRTAPYRIDLTPAGTVAATTELARVVAARRAAMAKEVAS